MAKKKVTKRKTMKSKRNKSGSAGGGSAKKTTRVKKRSTKKKNAMQAKPVTKSDPGKHGFPIVGIGASTGGLEAMEGLLNNMPTDKGMAFVVVMHQHPGHTNMLPQLLGKEREMPVVEAADGTKVEPNHVYVGPPGGHLAILNGTLGLKAIKGESGMAMVEQPQVAKYAGMPSSAIATGLADYVLLLRRTA